MGKERAGKIREFTLFARNVIKGKKKFEKQKNKVAIDEKKFNAVKALLKTNPFHLSSKIAAKVGCAATTVERYRRLLVKKGEIPATTPGDRAKVAFRGNAVPLLSQRKRKAILRKNLPLIKERAGLLYAKDKALFDSLKMRPAEITAKLLKKIGTRLEAFDPKKMKGPEFNKMHRFFAVELFFAVGSVESAALEKYKHPTAKLKAAEPKITPSQEAQAEFRDAMIKWAESTSRKFGLTPLEKAVLFGLSAKIPGAEIGRMFGCTKQAIHIIKQDLKRKGINLNLIK